MTSQEGVERNDEAFCCSTLTEQELPRGFNGSNRRRAFVKPQHADLYVNIVARYVSYTVHKVRIIVRKASVSSSTFLVSLVCFQGSCQLEGISLVLLRVSPESFSRSCSLEGQRIVFFFLFL